MHRRDREALHEFELRLFIPGGKADGKYLSS